MSIANAIEMIPSTLSILYAYASFNEFALYIFMLLLPPVTQFFILIVLDCQLSILSLVRLFFGMEKNMT